MPTGNINKALMHVFLIRKWYFVLWDHNHQLWHVWESEDNSQNIFIMRKFKVQNWWVNKMCHHIISIINIIDGNFKALVFITAALRTILANRECSGISRSCTVYSVKLFFFNSSHDLHCLVIAFRSHQEFSTRYFSDLSYPFIIYNSCLLPKL